MPTICPTCGHTLLDIEEVDFDRRAARHSRPSPMRSILEDIRPGRCVIVVTSSEEKDAGDIVRSISPWAAPNNPYRARGQYAIHKAGAKSVLIRRVR